LIVINFDFHVNHY